MRKPVLRILAALVVSFLILAAGGMHFLNRYLLRADVSEVAAARAAEMQDAGMQPGEHATGEALADAGADDLLARIARLEDEVAMLRSEMERAPAGDGAWSGAAADPAGVAQRDTILSVVAEERERLATEREMERQAREMDAILSRASRVADNLGLGADDEKVLADLLLADREDRDTLMDEMRGLRGQPGGNEKVRESWEAYQEDRRTDLASAFGTDLADQILQMERPQDRRGGGGDSGRGPGGRGGDTGRGQGPGGRGRDR